MSISVIATASAARREAIHMTSRQAKIQEDTHFRIMRILQDNRSNTSKVYL